MGIPSSDQPGSKPTSHPSTGLDRNDDSFARAFFNGHLLEDRILPYPKDEPEKYADVRTAVEKFAQENVNSREIDEKAKMPPEVIEGMKALGLFGMIIPEEFGGFGLGSTEYAKVMETLVANDPALAITAGAHQSIGIKALLLFGTQEQKAKYLPKLATGEMIGAFALTEPTSGSDAQSIKTKAVLSPDGTHYILNGGKIWITNGGIADFFTVFAKVAVEDKGTLKEKVTAFMVERSMGVKSLGEEHKLGLKGSSTVQIIFEDARVPVENILGEVGKGFKVAMGVLNSGRLGLASGCIGASRKMIDESVKYAIERKQFDRRICDFKMIKNYITQMEVSAYVLESMVYMTTAWIDRGVHDYSMESAICKVYGSEICWNNINMALQIAGGNGYMKDYPFEKALRDSRINLIFEGTNEILRLFIALTGLQAVGSELKETQGALDKFFVEPAKGFGAFYGYASKRLRQKFSPEMAKNLSPVLEPQTKLLARSIADLSEASELLIKKYRKDIVEEQHDLHRVADIAIDIYAMCTTLARVSTEITDKGKGPAEPARQIASVFCSAARRRIKANLRSLEVNKDKTADQIADRVISRYS